MKPKISIITITFNSEKTLEETIESVVSQGYDNLEYLIIDGKSTDGTLDIVDRYREHINFVVSEPDKGISDAFNKGIAHATGEIIGIINSDDVLLPGALKTLSDNYEADVDVYRGNTVLWDSEKGTKISTRPTMEFPIYKRIKSVCHQSTFIRKEAYIKYGDFDLRFKYMMDADILHRYYIKGAKFKYIDKDLAAFRLGGVTSDNWSKKLKEANLMIRKNGGSAFLAFSRLLFFMLIVIFKKIAFNIIGEDSSRRIRYRKS